MSSTQFYILEFFSFIMSRIKHQNQELNNDKTANEGGKSVPSCPVFCNDSFVKMVNTTPNSHAMKE